jgi:hypothetical protein
MPNSINAFKVPLGPAGEPGLTNEQLKERHREVLKLVHAAMPSSRLLTGTLLKERIISENGLFYQAFDLVESRQMPLFDSADSRTGRRIATSISALYAELARLRDEASNAVIRIGELTLFAAELQSQPTDESRAMLDELSPEDLKLWRLTHSRKGKHLSIEFDDGNVILPLPRLQEHIAETSVRKIRFRVKQIQQKSAILSEIKDALVSDAASTVAADKYPKALKLLRPSDSLLDSHDGWFLLYLAEYKGLPVEATVRMALKAVNLKPSHMELVDISNARKLEVDLKRTAVLLRGSD